MNLDIEQLIEKYYEGETTLEEEQQLRAFFLSENVPAHLENEAKQFWYFAQTRKEQPSAGVSYRTVTQLSKLSKVRSLNSWGLRIAASLTLLVIGFGAGIWYTHRQGGISEENSQVAEMKKMLQTPEQTSASERILAVNQSYELEQGDEEITQILLNTMNFDENVNVRLAACQALQRFENEPMVREGLIQSLKIQTDPNIQLALIEALVLMKEKRATSEMLRLAQNQKVLEIVRLKAQEGAHHLKQEKQTNNT